MSQHTDAPAPADVTPAPTDAVAVTGWHRVVAWTLLLAMLATVVATVVLGARVATPRELVQALEAGEVELVELEGDFTAIPASEDPDVMGAWLLTVRWRDGLLAQQTELVRLSPAAVVALQNSGPDFLQLDGDVARQWLAQPEALSDEQFAVDPLAAIISLTPENGLLLDEFTSPAGAVGDWLRVPILLIVAYGLTVLLALTSLAAGPAPQWMTRWGWFWLVVGVPALGVLVYALLGAHGAPGPRSRREYRMPGVTGFALAVVTSVVVGVLLDVLRSL